MWNILKTIIVLEKSNKKNIFTFVIVALFVLGMIIYVKVGDFGNSQIEKASEYQSLSIVLAKFQNVDATENGNGSDLYKNLVLQKQYITKQKMSITTKRPDLFLDTAIDLVKVRDESYKLEGYKEVANYLPSKIENEFDRVFYEYIKSTGMSLSVDLLSFFHFLTYLFGLLGGVWFVFMSIYSCGIMIDDFRHTSLIKGYPITFDKYVLGKCISSMILIGVFLIECIVCSLPLIYFRGLGDPSYPIAVYNGFVDVYPIYKYLIVAILYMICLSIFTILLSIILNMLLKNMYLTLFVELTLFVLPMFFPNLMNLVPFNPFNYLNFTQLLNGQTYNLATPENFTSTNGFVYIGISIVIMVAVIKIFLTTGKLTRYGGVN